MPQKPTALYNQPQSHPVASEDPIGSKHMPRAPSLASMGPFAPGPCEISLLTLPLSLVSLVLGLGTQWSQAMHCEAAQTTQTGNMEPLADTFSAREHGRSEGF